MIVDSIKNAALYKGNSLLTEAFKFLNETDLLKLQPGRNEIDGDKLYCVTPKYETKPLSEGKFEVHRKYIDVQYIISGSEMICVRELAGLKGSGYIIEKDIEKFETAEPYSRLILHEGMFAVFYPHEAHMPCIQIDGPQQVMKVVVKVAVS